jgi:hypothetical protein
VTAFPLSILKAALSPSPEEQAEKDPDPQIDLTPVIQELRKIRAAMDIVAKHPRQTTP